MRVSDCFTPFLLPHFVTGESVVFTMARERRAAKHEVVTSCSEAVDT